ncbi:hypothetical protein GCM10028774_63240 [Spirosoma jeollabukense]
MLIRLYALVETHLGNEGFGLEELVSERGMSRTTLFGKVKAMTGLTAHELLRHYRLKQADHRLGAGSSVGETGYPVGFESPAYFSMGFGERYPVSSREVVTQEGENLP